MSITQRNTARTRDDLVRAAVDLWVRGEEPTMRAVAAEAGVGERTIYRYFPNRDALEEAVHDHVAPRLGAPLCSSVNELEEYVDALYGAFEQNADLTVATVTTPWTQSTLAGTRSRNLAALRALLADGFPEAEDSDVVAAAASLRTVLSGAGWVYQRHSCGLSADEVRANAVWLVREVLAALDR